jgi:DNA-binding winged helix-turn-helix (wHTH) protein
MTLIMRHLIEHAMIYDANTGVINKLEEEESFIQLSNQSSRLLYELLKSDEQILTRDDLIKRVWEDYGFTGSTISLNVAVSELRKAFKMLGHDPMLIQTVRRKGLCFIASVESAPEDRPPKDEQIAVPKKNLNADKKNPGKTRILLTSLILLNILVITICWMSYAQQFDSTDSPIDITELLTLGAYKKCSLYWVGPRDFDTVTSLKMLTEQEVEKQKINCAGAEIDVFYSFFKKMQIKSSFISLCYKSTSTHYKNCQTYRQFSG